MILAILEGTGYSRILEKKVDEFSDSLSLATSSDGSVSDAQ
jgi:hypothetical protein